MQEKFYVGCSGDTLGPFGEGEILRKIHNGDIKLTDYVYLDDSSEWVVILDYRKISEQVSQTQDHIKSSAFHNNVERDFDSLTSVGVRGGIPVGEQTQINLKRSLAGGSRSEKVHEKEWFVLHGKNKFGPFGVSEVLKMLKKKTVFEYDYAWHSDLKNWLKISEIDDFSAVNLKQIKSDGVGDTEELFFRRRHARVNNGGSVIIHNNEALWRGSGLEISVGGAGIEISGANIEKGSSLYLHFQPGDGMPSFNAVCLVVNKRLIKNNLSSEGGEAFRYGVKFKTIGRAAKMKIHEISEEKLGQNAEVIDLHSEKSSKGNLELYAKKIA